MPPVKIRLRARDAVADLVLCRICVLWDFRGGRGEVTIVPRQLRGECLCCAVSYTVSDAFEYALYCHCSKCRRATGSAFKALAGTRRSNLNLDKGSDCLSIFGNEDAAHDAHCAKCGSLIFSVVRDGAYVHVAMGTLLDDPSIRPSAHIFVGSKAAWHEITDDLPRYSAFPES